MTARKVARHSSSTIHDSKENCKIHTSTRLIFMQNPFQKVETVALDIGSRCFGSYPSLLRNFPPLPTQHPLSHSQKQREKKNKCSCVCNILNRYKYGKILWKACLQALQINLLELTLLQAKQYKTLEDSKIQPHKNHGPESLPDNNLLSPNFVFLSPLLHHDLRYYAIITYQSQHNSMHEIKNWKEEFVMNISKEMLHEWSNHMNYGKLVQWTRRLAASICKKASSCWKNVKRKHCKHSEL